MKAQERQSLSLRVSVIDRCQLRCRYCRPEEGVDLLGHDDIISYENIAYFIRCLQESYSLEKVRITGGDPLVRRDIDSLVRMIADLSVPDIALTTNAQLLEEKAQLLKDAGLGRVNISFDSLNPETFSYLTRGGSLEKTLAGIRAAVDCGLDSIKLNMVVIKGVNDGEVTDMLEFALKNKLSLRYLELMPIGAAAEGFEGGYVSSDETRLIVSERYSLEPIEVENGSTSKIYNVDGGAGTVGFISPYSESFCGGCRRLRLTSDGHILGCLSRGETIPIKPLLESEAECAHLIEMIEKALSDKGSCPDFPEKRSMVSIGG